MIFEPLRIPGACVIRPDKIGDDRGFFARVWCQREFEAQGLCIRVAQANISHSRRKGTLRGMHYQVPPATETKLVRCTRGAIYDVILDLRPGSPTRCEWVGVELTAEDRSMLYVPRGFAHGFQTLTDDAEVFYQVSEFYSPENERGLRYNDPSIGIEWPEEVTVISDKDRSWPDYSPDLALAEVESSTEAPDAP